MLRALLKTSWRQHPMKQQLYGHLTPITKTIQIRRTRHAEHSWRSKDELISDVLLWIPHMDEQRLDDQLKPIYKSCVPIQDVTWRTCWDRWTIVTGGERELEKSVQVAWDDDDLIYLCSTCFSDFTSSLGVFVCCLYTEDYFDRDVILFNFRICVCECPIGSNWPWKPAVSAVVFL